MTDQTQLIRKIRERDERAFKMFCELYAPSLYLFAYKYVKSDAISTDIVQI